MATVESGLDLVYASDVFSIRSASLHLLPTQHVQQRAFLQVVHPNYLLNNHNALTLDSQSAHADNCKPSLVVEYKVRLAHWSSK